MRRAFGAPYAAGLCVQQIFDTYRQLANAYTGGVVDRIGDGRRGAHIGQFAEAFDAGRIHGVVNFRHQNDLGLLERQFLTILSAGGIGSGAVCRYRRLRCEPIFGLINRDRCSPKAARIVVRNHKKS